MNLESPSEGSNEGDDKRHRCCICGYGLSYFLNWIQNSYDFADEVKLIRCECMTEYHPQYYVQPVPSFALLFCAAYIG